MADQIPYWGVYGNNSQFDSDPTQTAAGRAFLDAIRQYDPSAGFSAHQMGGEGASGQNYYTFNGDLSKVPGYTGHQVDLNPGAFDPLYTSAYDSAPATGHDLQGTILDPSKVQTDSLLGRNTDRSNYQLPDQSSWLDWAGPLAVMGFGGLMGGIPGLYEGVFGQGAYGGGSAASGAASGAGGGFDFGAGASGADLGAGIPGEAAGAGTGSFDYGAGAAGTDLGNTGGLTQAQWDEIIAGQPENGSFVGPNGTDPNGFTPGDYRDLEGFNAGLDNPSLLDRLGNALKNPGDLLGKIPGLLGGSGGGSGGGGSGSNLLVNAGQQQKPQVEDAAAILARLYGQRSGLLGARNG